MEVGHFYCILCVCFVSYLLFFGGGLLDFLFNFLFLMNIL